MWGSAFYDDDPQNGPLANTMGIVMGTSHHEPWHLLSKIGEDEVQELGTINKIHKDSKSLDISE